MEKVPDETMDLFQDINKLTGIKASRFSTIQDTEELLKKMLFNDKLIKVKVGETKAFICLTKCILSCWSINQASLLPL